MKKKTQNKILTFSGLGVKSTFSKVFGVFVLGLYATLVISAKASFKRKKLEGCQGVNRIVTSYMNQSWKQTKAFFVILAFWLENTFPRVPNDENIQSLYGSMLGYPV